MPLGPLWILLRCAPTPRTESRLIARPRLRWRGVDLPQGPRRDHHQHEYDEGRRRRPGDLDRLAAIDLRRLGRFATAAEAEDRVEEHRLDDQEDETGDREDEDGQVADRFLGSRWAAYYPYSEPGKCVILKIQGNYSNVPRGDCPNGYNSELNALSGEAFWTPKDGSAEFRVLWGRQEVGRCQIADQRCEIRFPPA